MWQIFKNQDLQNDFSDFYEKKEHVMDYVKRINILKRFPEWDPYNNASIYFTLFKQSNLIGSKLNRVLCHTISKRCIIFML